MHSLLLSLGILVALLLRQWAKHKAVHRGNQSWPQRWQGTLGLFLIPPLFLGMAAIAVLAMGLRGSMLGVSVGWPGYWAALGICGLGWVSLLSEGFCCWRSHQRIRQLPKIQVQGVEAYALATPLPFAGRVGLWNADLVVSQGLLDLLQPEELECVLLHEQAHRHFQDTFWFFGLGWIRRWSTWLPQTEALWQELLLLRELRADHWAAQFTDPLCLAETLLKVARGAATAGQATEPMPWAMAPFADETLRLEERIEQLIEPEPGPQATGWGDRLTLGLAYTCVLLPLLSALSHSPM